MLRKPISISLRLTLLFGGIFLFGWLLFGGAMWLVLKSTLKGERYQTLDRRLDRLQQLLDDRQEENTSDQQQDFRDFAQATGSGLSEIFRPDGTRAYPSPRLPPWPFHGLKRRRTAGSFCRWNTMATPTGYCRVPSH
ncbi:MAG TPA: hypothetical protein VGN16_14325 [Acidobacteriaceae bacterium]|jgi:hypothetical protein